MLLRGDLASHAAARQELAVRPRPVGNPPLASFEAAAGADRFVDKRKLRSRARIPAVGPCERDEEDDRGQARGPDEERNRKALTATETRERYVRENGQQDSDGRAGRRPWICLCPSPSEKAGERRPASPTPGAHPSPIRLAAAGPSVAGADRRMAPPQPPIVRIRVHGPASESPIPRRDRRCYEIITKLRGALDETRVQRALSPPLAGSRSSAVLPPARRASSLPS